MLSERRAFQPVTHRPATAAAVPHKSRKLQQRIRDAAVPCIRVSARLVFCGNHRRRPLCPSE